MGVMKVESSGWIYISKIKPTCFDDEIDVEWEGKVLKTILRLLVWELGEW